ncbi:hypothetical protein CR513_50049, partial [Mucuna pruriens]
MAEDVMVESQSRIYRSNLGQRCSSQEYQNIFVNFINWHGCHSHIGMGVTLTFLMFSYFYGAFMLGPSVFYMRTASILFGWIGLLGLSVVITIIRVINWLVKQVI